MTIRRTNLPPTTDDADLYRTHMPQVRRRWNTDTTHQIVRGNQRLVVHRGPPRNMRLPRLHPLIYVVVTVLLVFGGNALISWCGGIMDNVHYGYPRVSQMDAVVGHSDSPTNETHFVFLNLHGHIQIIEIPGDDASKARIFTGPILIGAGQDLLPVTGEIRNENGRLDLIVHIQGQQIVYVNDGSTFHQQQ